MLRQMAQAVGELDQALRAGAAERPELLGPLDADESAALKEKLVELQRQYRAALPHAGRVEVGRVEEDGDEDEEYVAGVSRRALVEAGAAAGRAAAALVQWKCTGPRAHRAKLRCAAHRARHSRVWRGDGGAEGGGKGRGKLFSGQYLHHTFQDLGRLAD